jgi:hypothetical protein
MKQRNNSITPFISKAFIFFRGVPSGDGVILPNLQKFCFFGRYLTQILKKFEKIVDPLPNFSGFVTPLIFLEGPVGRKLENGDKTTYFCRASVRCHEHPL